MSSIAPTAAATLASITEVLRALAPADVRVGALAIDDAYEKHLFAVEATAIRGSSRHRRREFASGRVLLRQLIDSDLALPVGEGGRPQLPANVRASLAHDSAFVIAAVTCSPHIATLGLDIEVRDELEDDVVAAIRRPDEAHIDAMLLFVIKEAVYKAWSGSGGRFLDHHSVCVQAADGFFQARVVDEGVTYRGGYGFPSDRIVALTSHPSG